MKSIILAAAAAAFVLAPGAWASLILESPTEVSGTGLGTVSTILTISSAASSTTETGCVGGTPTATTTGSTLSATTGACSGSTTDVKSGASQTLVEPLSASSVTSASNFGLVFNASEPNGNGITLDNLQASFYSSTGTLLYQTSGVNCSALHAGSSTCDFSSTQQGTGNSGFLFGLDATQAAAATAAHVFSQTSPVYVGLLASASNATGGNETFFLANRSGSVSTVPEPASLALFGIGGILMLAGTLRRKRV